ncbi:LysR family transcriptional regulator [Azospirillum brasilense]|uniref:LysR family transcriptional regulator n=1 Tax=Azospirillum brasilense TaxID=192 RepID=UPI000E0B7CCA|nr:LysR family transcriptional regulator [Azospirillum brasilense]
MVRHDVQTLLLFLRACETKSITRAASQSNLALSAASRRMKLLEEGCGTVLLHRLPYGVEPTPAGLAVLRYARGVLGMNQQLDAELADYRAGVRGSVRVFASSSALVQRLAGDLSAFARAFPSIRLELQERPSVEIVEALYQKETDIGVIVRGGDLWQLRTRMYAEDRLAVVVPSDHPLAQGGPVAFASVLKEELVTLDHATAVHRLVINQARRSGQTPRVRVQVRSFEAMCQMVLHGLGLGILPELAAQPLVAAFGLTLLLLDEPWARRELAICTRAGDELDASAQRLIDFLVTRTGAAGR